MRFATPPSPYLAPARHTPRIMAEVSLALVPGLAALVVQFGPGVLIQCLVALVAALLAEAAALRLRGRPSAATLWDGSAALTAVLLAVSLPPLAPVWVAGFGAVFAILVGKQLYGGLGHNPFNPAMVGYAVLLVSFPKPMTAWLAPLDLSAAPLGFAETWNAIFQRELPEGLGFDALTLATPLDSLKNPSASAAIPSVGAGWAWVNSGFLLGGLWLLGRKLIDWRIPVGFLGALSACALMAFLWDAAHPPTPLFHLFGGATMLGAFFIATDPVTAATTPKGRWIHGAGCGALVFAIRAYGGYPDGVAFAVLLMNLAAPTLDHYTRPRVYGT
ncbi:RnfABCDGE type electron transport complex subunit D [Methylomagnum ishizawai]|uniref:RnfABCDGE type electron transport complex subunit D n=1 Tax=Methylomagnum ishizawai TaxID=1760988 RepID=UPI001C31F131|nr:RnfABCDGE type electron transport complex subunit D [Methylomagnum ishizawai]BBL74288.1 electron transport complex subunit D [Methylomagnum ishizawai]